MAFNAIRESTWRAASMPILMMSCVGIDVGGPHAVSSGKRVIATAVAIVNVVPTAYTMRLAQGIASEKSLHQRQIIVAALFTPEEDYLVWDDMTQPIQATIDKRTWHPAVATARQKGILHLRRIFAEGTPHVIISVLDGPKSRAHGTQNFVLGNAESTTYRIHV